MKSINVTIREKDKRGKNLSLFNLKDEVTNFLYKDTVANSTKADQQFYVLMYFASIKAGEKSFVEVLFDTVIPRFNSLNESFAKKSSYLRQSEYALKVAEQGLKDLFAGDIFFILAEAVLNIENINTKYKDVLENNKDLKEVVDRLSSIYRPLLELNYEVFKSTRIRDYRTDDDGNTHDLSKSVYRTIQMRNARNLELNLQRYTTVKSITSQSPIVMNIIQNIDPQIIFDLWDKYHVADYVKSVYHIINDSPLLSGIVSGGIVAKYTAWKTINGNQERKRKKEAKIEFEIAKVQGSRELESLNVPLVRAVLDSNEMLKEELARSKKELSDAMSNVATADNKELIKKLQNRVYELDNLEIHAEMSDEDDKQDI